MRDLANEQLRRPEVSSSITLAVFAAPSRKHTGSVEARHMADDYTLGDIVRLIDGLAESTHASFARVEDRLDRIESRLDRIETKLDRHETQIEAVEAGQP